MLQLLRSVDTADYAIKEQQTIATLKNTLADVMLDIQDYEFSETKAEQLIFSADAKRRLEKIHTLLLALPVGVAGPVDIAQLSAYIEQIKERLSLN